MLNDTDHFETTWTVVPDGEGDSWTIFADGSRTRWVPGTAVAA